MKATPGLTRKAFRVLVRGPGLLGCASLCFAECVLQAALRKLDTRTRSQILRRWSTRILSIMQVQVSVIGPVPAHGLIASNHLSYLDILVLSAVAQCAFVSKSEVKSWPLVGWVASMTGAVFVDRGRRSQTQRAWPQMQERLLAGERLVLFPEATSSNGRQLLPFRSSLFEAAVAGAVPITASCIAYELAAGDGDPSLDVCYWGEMTMLPHLFKLLMKNNVRAMIRFADKPRIFADRKQAALEMQQQVQELGDASGLFRKLPEKGNQTQTQPQRSLRKAQNTRESQGMRSKR